MEQPCDYGSNSAGSHVDEGECEHAVPTENDADNQQGNGNPDEFAIEHHSLLPPAAHRPYGSFWGYIGCGIAQIAHGHVAGVTLWGDGHAPVGAALVDDAFHLDGVVRLQRACLQRMGGGTLAQIDIGISLIECRENDNLCVLPLHRTGKTQQQNNCQKKRFLLHLFLSCSKNSRNLLTQTEEMTVGSCVPDIHSVRIIYGCKKY